MGQRHEVMRSEMRSSNVLAKQGNHFQVDVSRQARNKLLDFQHSLGETSVNSHFSQSRETVQDL